MLLDTTSHKGQPVALLDALPEPNEIAFDITFVKTDLTEGSLYDYEGKVKILMGVPSLDTGPCQVETRRFNELLSGRDGVVGIVISKDLPFAMRRFCETEGIKNIVSASDFRYTDFTREFATEMTNGPLKGLSARTIFVIDKENIIRYVELTPDVAAEPNYEKVLAEVDKLL